MHQLGTKQPHGMAAVQAQRDTVVVFAEPDVKQAMGGFTGWIRHASLAIEADLPSRHTDAVQYQRSLRLDLGDVPVVGVNATTPGARPGRDQLRNRNLKGYSASTVG